jgi:phage repressor protein C with HTH and peptisase S24 domain
MPAAVIPIGTRASRAARRTASWATFHVAQPGRASEPYGILLADNETGEITMRLRDASCLEGLDEGELDILDALADDLGRKGREMGGLGLLDALEDSLSGFFRISDRTSISYSGDARATVDRLFDQFVDSESADGQFVNNDVRPFVTHLPFYSLRAAATKFGEQMESEEEPVSWVRTPDNLRLHEGMFVATVVGRSMEPRIPDGSACIFRAPVTGSRNGRLLLIEKLGDAEASRYTVKRYARQGALVESADREGAIRLEPLNKEFPAFDLTADECRVIAEFVQVLQPDALH